MVCEEDGWSTGLVPSRPELPRGWSYPVKPSEIETLFPGVGHVYWWGWSRKRAAAKGNPTRLFLRWSPRSAMPQPGLTIVAVPSQYRQAVRAWIETQVAPAAKRWLAGLDTNSPTWLDDPHVMTWTWTPSDSS